MGTIIEIEATTIPVEKGQGSVIVTGIVEEEEMGGDYHKIKRKGTAKGSVDNVITVLRRYLNVDPRDYDIHLNFPGGTPIDGPSAGAAIATAIYSAIKNIAYDNFVTITGEVSIRGL